MQTCITRWLKANASEGINVRFVHVQSYLPISERKRASHTMGKKLSRRHCSSLEDMQDGGQEGNAGHRDLKSLSQWRETQYRHVEEEGGRGIEWGYNVLKVIALDITQVAWWDHVHLDMRKDVGQVLLLAVRDAVMRGGIDLWGRRQGRPDVRLIKLRQGRTPDVRLKEHRGRGRRR